MPKIDMTKPPVPEPPGDGGWFFDRLVLAFSGHGDCDPTRDGNVKLVGMDPERRQKFYRCKCGKEVPVSYDDRDAETFTEDFMWERGQTTFRNWRTKSDRC